MRCNFDSERQYPDLHIYSGENKLGETWVYQVSAFSKVEADKLIRNCDGHMPLSSLVYHGGAMPSLCEFKYHCGPSIMAFKRRPQKAPAPAPQLVKVFFLHLNRQRFSHLEVQHRKIVPVFSEVGAIFLSEEAAQVICRDVHQTCGFLLKVESEEILL